MPSHRILGLALLSFGLFWSAGWVSRVAAQAPGEGRPARPPDIFFVPTWQPIVHRMLDLAGVTRGDVVYDLGSGDGRIVILAAQRYGARGVGIEIDPKLVAMSRQVAREAQVDDQVVFLEGDLFTADLSPATVVTLFLSAHVNARLEPKLRRELRPGARIVSHQFGIGSWTPDKTVRAVEDGTDLFLWIVNDRPPDREDGQLPRANSRVAR